MAHKLSPFFQVKLGNKFSRSIKTGQREAGRYYSLLLTVVTGANVEFHVSSVSKCPTGYVNSGSDKEHGTVKVSLLGMNTLEDVLNQAVREADPEFVEKHREAA